MRLPRDLSGEELGAGLCGKYRHLWSKKQTRPYSIARQTGSHIRLITDYGGEHQVTIPRHKDLRVGTLNAILGDVANHLGLNRDELIDTLF